MTERQTFPKSTCCIPGCPRWSRKFEAGCAWICYRHWRMAPRRCRRALTKAWRARNDALSRWRGSERTDEVRDLWNRLDRLSERLWTHMTRRVILQEAGL